MPAPLKGIALESLTWPEAEALFRRTPAPVIVLPVGAWTKEHGLHLPLNNDWIPRWPPPTRAASSPRPSSATSSTSWSDSLAPTSRRRRRCHGIWVDGAFPYPDAAACRADVSVRCRRQPANTETS